MNRKNKWFPLRNVVISHIPFKHLCTCYISGLKSKSNRFWPNDRTYLVFLFFFSFLFISSFFSSTKSSFVAFNFSSVLVFHSLFSGNALRLRRKKIIHPFERKKSTPTFETVCETINYSLNHFTIIFCFSWLRIQHQQTKPKR